MTKKITALLMAALLFVGTALAVTTDDSLISPHASDYLDGCAITTTPAGNRKIVVDYVVYGTGEMTVIGANKVEIERWDDYSEDWVYDRTLTGSSTYNDVDHAATVSFYGTRGEQYRALIYAYAKNANGMDTTVYDGSGVYCD